jgi:hypothetical protein
MVGFVRPKRSGKSETVWPLLYLPAVADAQLSHAEHLGIGIEWGGATLSMRCYTMASFRNQVAS